jgi:hypothetical protein
VPSGAERRQNVHVKVAEVSRLRGSQDRGGNSVIRCVLHSRIYKRLLFISCNLEIATRHDTTRHDTYDGSPTFIDYLADSVDAFLTSNTESPRSPSKPNTFDIVESPAIPLGLTFSFPVEQTARDKGILLTWTKGFSAKNAINKDVVKLLQDAFDRKHLHVKCVALVNDVSLHALSPFAQKSVSMLCDQSRQ